MADPVTLGTIGLGTSIAGGGMSAIGNILSGNSQKQMYDYQAKVAQINAQIDKQNAEWEYTKGDIETQQYGMKASQVAGQIRATQGASNIDVNTGSNAEVQRSQHTIAGMDMAQLRANAAKNAYDYTVKSVMDTNQAAAYTVAGENAKRAGYIGAASSILGSVSSVSSKWIQGRTAGMFGGGGDSTGPVRLFDENQSIVGYA